MDVDPIASSSGGGVVFFLRLVPWSYHFLLDVSRGSSHKTTIGIIGDYEMASAILGDYKKTSALSSIIGVGEGISRPDS